MSRKEQAIGSLIHINLYDICKVKIGYLNANCTLAVYWLIGRYSLKRDATSQYHRALSNHDVFTSRNRHSILRDITVDTANHHFNLALNLRKK